MTLLVKSGGEAAVPEWQAAFGAIAPHLDVRWWEDPAVAATDVAYVLCWDPDPGRLATFPNLRLICSAGAGVDHITKDPTWPKHVPLVRMGGSETVRQMMDYVAMAALFLLRDMRHVTVQQAARQWDDSGRARLSSETRVGILGLGNLGAPAATLLRDIGFMTAGWARTAKSLPGVDCFAGLEALPAFLVRTDILVCLLPQTGATTGLLNAARLLQLPRGASIVNAGRGGHVDLPDLIEALDSGHLAGAMLDVFDAEPLPPEHPLWSHPKITITPHIASLPSRQGRAAFAISAISAIDALQAGATLPNRYDPALGY